MPPLGLDHSDRDAKDSRSTVGRVGMMEKKRRHKEMSYYCNQILTFHIFLMLRRLSKGW